MDYFARLPAEALAKELENRIDAYYNWLLTSGRLGRWRIGFDTYYGQRGSHNSSWVSEAGEQGELSFLMSNEFGNLVQHLLVLTTQSRPAIECGAINTDFKSQAQTILGKGLLEYYLREGKVERYLRQATEISLIMDTGWVVPEWDYTLGPAIRPSADGKGTINAGDVRCRARTPLDVIVDFARQDAEEHDWRILHDYRNKYDLAAIFKHKAAELIAAQRDNTNDALFRFGDVATAQGTDYTSEIDVYAFYHKKTPAMPQGRMLLMATGNIVLWDGPIPYRLLPGARVCPAEMILSSFGYSRTNDLLGLQDVIDACISASTTNMTNLAMNNLWCEDAADFDFEQLTSGMNMLEGGTKPEVLQLAKMPPEMFKFMEFIISRMEALSGVNSVARGNLPPGKDLSGAAMALLQSMAIQFNSGLQQSYGQLIEDTGTQIIFQLQDFAKHPRTAMIAGESRKYMLESFQSGSIDKLQRVYVNQKNPLSNTTSGKLTIAQDLLAQGMIKNVAQYLEVLETGTLESLYLDEEVERMTIKSENEALSKGEFVRALRTDYHHEHIRMHRKVVADPEARKDQGLVERTDYHIREHEMMMMNPMHGPLFAILGIPSLAPPPPPPGGAVGKADGVVDGQTPPQNQEGPPPDSAIPPENAPPGVQMPGLPNNPMTGEDWNPVDGGLGGAAQGG